MRSTDRTAAPLGPGSLTWRHLGDARNLLLAQRAGVLQTMHPAIAAALIDHSDFFEDPIGRLVRSAGPILGVVFDADPSATGRWVREQHPRIRGTDESGRRYHALDPETYFWAHATFFEAQIATQELFGEPLSIEDRRLLYRESITWYSRYGLTMRPVPPDYDAFVDYWHSMLDDVLEPTSIALSAVRSGRLPAPRQRLPRLAWPLLGPLAGSFGPWLVRVTLPERARAELGISLGRSDRAGLAALRRAVRTAWPLLPDGVRRLPRAREAELRSRL